MFPSDSGISATILRCCSLNSSDELELCICAGHSLLITAPEETVELR